MYRFQISSSGDRTTPASGFPSCFDRRHQLRQLVAMAVRDDWRRSVGLMPVTFCSPLVHIAKKGGCHSSKEKLWWEVMKSSRKPLLMKFAISCSLLSQFPILSFMLTIRFLLLRTRAEVWKKVEFSSPSTTQEIWAFILQKSASSLEISARSDRRDLSNSIKNSFGPFPSAIWMPRSLAQILFFLMKNVAKLIFIPDLSFRSKRSNSIGQGGMIRPSIYDYFMEGGMRKPHWLESKWSRQLIPYIVSQ